MDVQQTLLDEVQESMKLYDRIKEEGIHKRDLKKRIELINWGPRANEKS
jgi:hypothetical protein